MPSPHTKEQQMDPRLRLINRIKEDFRAGKLKVPSLPEVAFRIRSAIQDQNKSALQIAKIIQLDPVLTARLLQVVNSPLYRGARKIVDCHKAVSRLGFSTTRNLVSSFAVQQVFGARNPRVRKTLKSIWRHSSHVAAISYVLGRLTSGIQPDRALLAGLVHDIGVLPVLQYTEACPEVLHDEAEFIHLVRALSKKLGTLVLKAWNMDEELTRIPELIADFDYAPDRAADCADIVIVAHVHAEYNDAAGSEFPDLTKIASYRKLPISKMGADASLELLEEARGEVAEIMQMILH